ncbi:MAG: 4'-phosphopantetheinyl transferase superfamily protein, partial [Neisseria sp.]|nr:4'-phosphopantetheinyl transferase superfamily protein [Neisseria sp.]
GRTDWRVSRVLKYRAGEAVRSLSHSNGRAAVLAAEGGIRCGVDLEQIRQRDFAALAEWVADESEYDYLQKRGWQASDFYRLWCCKEALLKACNGDFPADMRKVGYAFDGQGALLGLRADGGFYGQTTVTADGFMVAVVWQGIAECCWQALGAMILGEIEAV